jgi:formamidopyrimidine-DNA glycosylase
MPELPEVETLCRQMDEILCGKEILSVSVHDRKIGNIRTVTGHRVCKVRRRAKSVVVTLDKNLFLIIHLRMSGRLLWVSGGRRIPHTRATLAFRDGWIYLIDPRRFATVTLSQQMDATAPLLDLSQGLRTPDLTEAATARRCPVKAYLMDQKALGGIGNIYACEILHRAGISPWRRACDLDSRQWGKVKRAAENILIKAIVCRGTSVSDWTDFFGEKGEYQKHLKVYGRAGKPCHRCGAPIIRAVMNGRGTFFCTSCQAV